MTEEQFERFVRKTVTGYNRPPATPREEMWRCIEAALRDRGDDGSVDPELGVRRPVAPRVWWSVGVAAALAAGIAIGWFAPRRGPSADFVRAPAAGVTAYRVATTEHLTQVETFLTVFQQEARAGRADRQTIAPAGDLLFTTQLLLDSPAGTDVGLRTLLEDVELVLAQIAQYSGAGPVNELDLIDQGIEQRAVLLKLQAAVAAGTQGVL